MVGRKTNNQTTKLNLNLQAAVVNPTENLKINCLKIVTDNIKAKFKLKQVTIFVITIKIALLTGLWLRQK